MGPFYWMSDINDSGTHFVYQVLMTWALVTVMGATDMLLIELVPNANAMLAVTLAIMVTGTYFLYAGFFLQASEMPAYLGWIVWTVPTSYGFTGDATHAPSAVILIVVLCITKFCGSH